MCVCVGGGQGWHELVLSTGIKGSLGSKSCRRASAGRLFCVGGWEGGMNLFWAGAREFRALRNAAGRAPGDCSACREAPGDCSERGQGVQAQQVSARRVPANCSALGRTAGGRTLLWAGEWGVQAGRAAAGPGLGDGSAWGMGMGGRRRDIVLGRGRRSSGSKNCRRAGDLGGGGGERQEIGLSGRKANSGSETRRRASAGILFALGEQRQGRRRDIVMSGRIWN